MKYRLMLLAAALFWGGAFVAQRVSTDTMGPFAFNGLRFWLGAVVITPIALWMSRYSHTRTYPRLPHIPLPVACIILGSVLFTGAAFQQVGIIYTTASKAGFITALYIVFVPFLGLFLHNPLRLSHVTGCSVALIGLYLFAFHSDGQPINFGDILELIGAVFWTAHILLIGRLAPYFSGIALSIGQFLICGALNFIAMILVAEPLSWAVITASAIPLLYCGILSSGAGFTLQVLAQKKVPPTEASLLCSFEMIFSALAAFLFIGEIMTQREFIGCILMSIGIFAAQIPSRIVFSLYPVHKQE
jgi:drug/metabolite transporter (DMT)-like permease